MIFDNRDIILKLNKRRYILILTYVTIMLVLFFSGFFQEKLKTLLAIGFSLIYIVYTVICYMLDYCYFSFNNETDHLLFRFVSMRPFNNAKKAIKIRKNDFAGFKFEKSYFGFKENLILSIKTKKGVANYPPISLSALSYKHKNMLKQALNQFV